MIGVVTCLRSVHGEHWNAGTLSQNLTAEFTMILPACLCCMCESVFEYPTICQVGLFPNTFRVAFIIPCFFFAQNLETN